MGDNPILKSIRKSLGRKDGRIQGVRPAVYPPRQQGGAEAEIERFLNEVRLLKGSAEKVTAADIRERLMKLAGEYDIRKASVWETQRLEELEVASALEKMGVELVPPNADKHEMEKCDLGVTEADLLLPETGTLVLRSSREKPRAVSLLPRVHLAIVSPEMLRADMQQVFAETMGDPYFVFITGPSRTADIELTVTLGMHGPRNLVVWMVET